MTPTCIKLVAALRDKGVALPEIDWQIERTYAGSWQRSAGAWSWSLIPTERYRRNPEALRWFGIIGSQWGVTSLLKSGFTLHHDIHGNTVLYPPEC